MSAAVSIPPVKPGDDTTPSVSPAAPAAVEFRYTQTESFPALLQQIGASLVITTYQAKPLWARPTRPTAGGPTGPGAAAWWT